MLFGHALNNGVGIPNIGRKCFHVNFYDFLCNNYLNIKYKPKTYLYFGTAHKSDLEFKQTFEKLITAMHQ